MFLMTTRKGVLRKKIMRKKPTIEVLLKDKKGQTQLARVLLDFKIPLIDRKFGTWSYMVNAGDGVVILDTGMKYKTPSLLLHGKRKHHMFRKTRNAEKIMYALGKVFPKKPVKEILLTHFHQDHSEEAPALQKMIEEKFGSLPEIRSHKNELKKRKMVFFKDFNLEKIFEEAGYDSWKLGKPLKDGEEIVGTNFKVVHLPGHTDGNIGFVNDKDKIAVVGSWYSESESESKFMQMAFHTINENVDKLYKSMEKFSEITQGFTLYFTHPKFKDHRKVFFKSKTKEKSDLKLKKRNMISKKIEPNSKK
jgi:glyoxylase-like metal-dependent hydrolase (beta-lactamase superfamily II)